MSLKTRFYDSRVFLTRAFRVLAEWFLVYIKVL